jgi:hypothetical protein
MKYPQHALVATLLILALYVVSYSIALKPVRVSTASPWVSGPPIPIYAIFGLGDSATSQSVLRQIFAPLNAIDENYIRRGYWEIDWRKTRGMRAAR